jgi:hypothetical protein
MSKQQALDTIAKLKVDVPNKIYALYRIGADWMFTTHSLEEVQRVYKVTVKEYQIIE